MAWKSSWPLDDERLFFLSTSFDDGFGVTGYSIDVEKAEDSHYVFSPEGMDALDEYLATKYSGRTLDERLSQFIADHASASEAEEALRQAVGQLGIKMQQFHFDSYDQRAASSRWKVLPQAGYIPLALLNRGDAMAAAAPGTLAPLWS